ncbi:uncharacterized protein si:ch211-122l24.6 [Trichomycterus rosablanca]|uniref:uncharacterized protein si:ch211-122l24.6 n=1 Tax=Trichomycterus rosablanca TaxID=2290929 RepID=UPI002F35648E
MGLSLSYPRVTEQESYEDPDEESDQFDLARAIQTTNEKYTYTMVQQRIRSNQEIARMQNLFRNWNTTAQELQKTFLHWTSTDLLNLWHLFDWFDANKDRLLDFEEYNACIDHIMNSATPEERKAMFEVADVHKNNCLNFEDFLQLMQGKIHSPVPSCSNAGDQDLVNMVANMDTFQQMCYGVF